MSMTMPYAPAMHDSGAKSQHAPIGFDVAVLGLWCALGLALSAIMLMTGFDANIAQILVMAG